MPYIVILDTPNFKAILDPHGVYPKASPVQLLDSLGPLPMFLIEGGTAPEIGFKNRFVTNYPFFSGWKPVAGSAWTMHSDYSVTYEGDPTKPPILRILSMTSDTEEAIIYENSWVFVKHQDEWFYTRAD